jgi:L-ribulose-5-phosphate 3-epimerase
VIHAKDFLVEGGAYRQMRTGQGQLHYRLLLDLIQKRKPYISILLEEVDEGCVEKCIRFIEAVAP